MKLLHNKITQGVLMALFVAGITTSCKKENNTQAPAVVKDPIVLDCNADIKKGGVLVNDPNAPIDYVVTCEISLNGDVVIEEGTVIEFQTDAGFSVTGSGSLAINGTASAPVLLTGVDKQAGSWKGVLFDSDDTKNSMIYTNVEYAGGKAFNSNGDLGAVIVWADSRLKMNNCKVSNSSSYGLNCSYGGAEVALNDNVFTSNNMPVKLNGELLMLATSNNDYSGNTKDFILLEFYTSTIKSAATWHKTNVPYLTTGSLLVIADMVTVEPGVVAHMGQGALIEIKKEGAFKAAGTVTEPIVFRGENPIAGAWEGIAYGFSSNPLNEISNAQILHAGGNNRKGAVYMWAKPTLKINNVVFSDIKTCAVYAAPSTSSPNTNLTLSACTYTNCGGQVCGD